MPIPPGQGIGLYPSWSADGRSFYYNRVFKSQDGTSATAQDFGIIKRDVSSGLEEVLVRRPFFIGPPRRTRDGQYIVTDSVDPTTNSRVILLIPVSGGEPRVLMRMPSEVKPQDLSNHNLGHWAIPAPSLTVVPDPVLVLKRLGDRTGMLGTAKDPSELWLVPLGEGEPKKIGNTPAGFILNSITMSQDGRRIAYTVADAASRPTTEVWALENFLPTSSKR